MAVQVYEFTCIDMCTHATVRIQNSSMALEISVAQCSQPLFSPPTAGDHWPDPQILQFLSQEHHTKGIMQFMTF